MSAATTSSINRVKCFLCVSFFLVATVAFAAPERTTKKKGGNSEGPKAVEQQADLDPNQVQQLERLRMPLQHDVDGLCTHVDRAATVGQHRIGVDDQVASGQHAVGRLEVGDRAAHAGLALVVGERPAVGYKRKLADLNRDSIFLREFLGQAALSALDAVTISVSETPKRELSSSTTTTSPRATTRPLTTTFTGSPTF